MSTIRTDLAPVYVGLLSTGDLQNLLRDIEVCGTNVNLTARGAEQELSTDSSLALSDTEQALQNSAGIQIRYVCDGKQWCDTLQKASGGTRIVRCEVVQEEEQVTAD